MIMLYDQLSKSEIVGFLRAIIEAELLIGVAYVGQEIIRISTKSPALR